MIDAIAISIVLLSTGLVIYGPFIAIYFLVLYLDR